MAKSNRIWLPHYCNPNAFLPKIQETRTLFSHRPYVFQDFVGRAMRFLQSDDARDMGFEYDESRILPCRWKCSDESLFGSTLAIYAYTGRYPFDKGKIGGNLNEGSIMAAVHHGAINVDFGGSHTSYIPGEKGGEFGRIWRPLQKEYSTNCGHLMAVMEPFRSVYADACQNIQIFSPDGYQMLVSIPNEFLQPNWSSHNVKLLVDLDTFTNDDVEYHVDVPHTHTTFGRTLFRLGPSFTSRLEEEDIERYMQKDPVPIGHNLTHHYFNMYDTNAEMDEHGFPTNRLNLYKKFILSAQHTPYPLKAAIVNANLEYNKLTDAVRNPIYKDYCFASFTGIFIDLFYEPVQNYLNLFQPLGISIKPAGVTQCIEMAPPEIFERFDALEPCQPKQLPREMAKLGDHEKILELFTYQPVRQYGRSVRRD